jgi:protoheme IX farnesyltransferase
MGIPMMKPAFYYDNYIISTLCLDKNEFIAMLINLASPADIVVFISKGIADTIHLPYLETYILLINLIFAVGNLWCIIIAMADPITITNLLKQNYWSLIKSRQTLMLVLTGIAGYLCQSLSSINWLSFLSLVGSLLITISGCTVLNMLFDRDIDRKMVRTSQRPLPAGQVSANTALFLGSALVVLGLVWSDILSMLYFGVILAGVVLHMGVYTLWLKRRSAWSILWGGIAGGMPILAGRAMAVGRIDALGVLLALVIVCWIPSHNLTLNALHQSDYLNAGIPTFLNTYGISGTYFMITFSSVLVALLVMVVCTLLGFSGLVFILLFSASLGLVGLGVFVWLKPSQNLIMVLYKYSSVFMMVSMLLLSLGGLMG